MMLSGVAVGAFLMALPALFSIINPVGGALIFREVAAGTDKPALARKVALYSFVVMLGALFAGSYVLAFFGVSLGALRCAGGLFVASTAWEILHRPETRQARKQEEAGAPGAAEDIALFPLTIPFTTGPGTIAVAIALGAEHPRDWPDQWQFFGGVMGAAAAMGVTIWVAYAASDRLASLLGPSGTRSVSRFIAFLLLAIGVQMVLSGVSDVIRP
jgi:multiple antibiotic resistance protein